MYADKPRLRKQTMGLMIGVWKCYTLSDATLDVSAYGATAHQAYEAWKTLYEMRAGISNG
jgi:hypothetical protein